MAWINKDISYEGEGEWLMDIYEVCPESIRPCTMKNRDFIEEDTGNIVHRTMMPQSPSKQAPWDLTHSPNCHQLPRYIFLGLIDGLKSLPF